MGFYSPATMVKDAQRHGLKLLPVDVTKSEWNCTLEAAPSYEFSVLSDKPSVEEQNEARKNLEHGQTIALRMGLRYVRGLREGAKALLRERAMTPFKSIHDLTHRVPELRKDELNMLAAIGALNAVSSFKSSIFEKAWSHPSKPETRNSKLSLHRRDALWQVERAVRPSGPLLEQDAELDAPSPSLP